MAAISVIIPVFNAEKTIRETIGTVSDQTHRDLELIIIDDGSTDASAAIISGIRGPRMKIFPFEHAGISKALNRGLAKASGEFVTFLDHDDLWAPDKLEAQIKRLEEIPSASVAYSWVNTVDEAGNTVWERIRPAFEGNVYKKMLMDNFLITCSNPMIRRRAFDEIGCFDETLRLSQDWDLFIRLAAKHLFTAVPRVQVTYRISCGAASSNLPVQAAESLRVIEKAFAAAPPEVQSLKKRSISNFYHYAGGRAVTSVLDKRRAVLSGRFLWRAFCAEPGRFAKARFTGVILLKIIAALLLPSETATRLVQWFRKRKQDHGKVSHP